MIWKVGSVAVLGSLLAQIDATVVNVSLSNLAVSLHSSLAGIQWVISGYLLALALMLPLNGWLVERVGAKPLYLWCFGTFTLSSACCGLAWSAQSLVTFRIVQGMSGGLMAPLAQMMMARVAGRHLAKVFGYVAVPILLGPLLGPVLAGAILQHASWRWLFLINVPLGVLATILAIAFLPKEDRGTIRRRFDVIGFLLLSPGLVLFLYGADHLQAMPGRVLFFFALCLLTAFAFWGRREQEDAIVNLALFRGKAFSAAAITQFLVNGLSFSSQMLIPILLIRFFGKSPSATGWLLTPMGLGMICSYPWVGSLTERFGIRKLAVAGASVALLGTLPFLFLTHYGWSVVVLACALFARGVGTSAVGIPSVSGAYASVPRAQLPMATTSLNIVQRLGGPTLTTLCATFLGWRMASVGSAGNLSGAFFAAFVLLCSMHVLLILSAMRLPLAVQHAEESV